MKRNFALILPMIVIIFLSLVLTSCFFENLFSENSSFSEDSVSSETETTPESESQTVSDEVSESSSNTERIELTTDEMRSVSEYIEILTLFVNIPDFENIEVTDQNWLASRFFFMAEYADPEDYDLDLQGAYIATIDSVESVVKEIVNPDAFLSPEFNFELDESLLRWLPEQELFSWFGRGFPPGTRISYPVEAYKIDDIIYYISIDLSDYTEMGAETDIKEIYDESGNEKIGTFNPETNTYNFSIDVQTQPKYLYKLIPNGEESYYLISKQKID